MVFIESAIFTKRLHEKARQVADDILWAIQGDLLQNPHRGDLVRGTGGIRKARTANPGRGKGKRGGFRYMFLYLQDRDHIHLLYLLDKGERADLTNDERTELKRLVSSIKAERRRR